MIIDTISSALTAIGIFVAVKQLCLSRKLAQIAFEHSFDQRYRELIKEIPMNVLLNVENKAPEDETRELIYNYFDLCNEQVYLKFEKKIKKERWDIWCSGIKDNLDKNQFRIVWNEVTDESKNTFSYLEFLIRKEFTDPDTWDKTEFKKYMSTVEEIS